MRVLRKLTACSLSSRTFCPTWLPSLPCLCFANRCPQRCAVRLSCVSGSWADSLLPLAIRAPDVFATLLPQLESAQPPLRHVLFAMLANGSRTLGSTRRRGLALPGRAHLNLSFTKAPRPGDGTPAHTHFACPAFFSDTPISIQPGETRALTSPTPSGRRRRKKASGGGLLWE